MKLSLALMHLFLTSPTPRWKPVCRSAGGLHEQWSRHLQDHGEPASCEIRAVWL